MPCVKSTDIAMCARKVAVISVLSRDEAVQNLKAVAIVMLWLRNHVQLALGSVGEKRQESKILQAHFMGHGEVFGGG